jgi:hypothetical protein
VITIFEVEDVQKARAFFDSVDLRAIMQQGGMLKLQDPEPQPRRSSLPILRELPHSSSLLLRAGQAFGDYPQNDPNKQTFQSRRKLLVQNEG